GPHVEDLAQDTFLRAYEAFPRFEIDGAKPSTWLLTIAARLAINEHKRRRPSPILENVTDDTTPETERGRHELGRAIEAALAELTEDHRIVFVLVELHDMSLG